MTDAEWDEFYRGHDFIRVEPADGKELVKVCSQCGARNNGPKGQEKCPEYPQFEPVKVPPVVYSEPQGKGKVYPDEPLAKCAHCGRQGKTGYTTSSCPIDDRCNVCKGCAVARTPCPKAEKAL